MKKFFKDRKKLIITLAIVIVVIAVWILFSGNGDIEYVTEDVGYGPVSLSVTETGIVKVSEKALLGFKNSGKIDNIHVSVGDQVSVGQALVSIDTDQLKIELSEARAALDVAQADYDQLLAGATQEEIRVAQTTVSNGTQDLANSQQNLANVVSESEQNLSGEYSDAQNEIDDAYLDVYNAWITTKSIETEYFAGNDQDSLTVRNSINTLNNSLSTINNYAHVNEIDQAVIDQGLTKTKSALSDARLALANVRGAMESSSSPVSSADKTAIDNQRTYINAAHTGIIGAGQDISSAKINNASKISDAKAAVLSKEIALQKARDELDLLLAGPTTESVNLYSAKVSQARARVNLLNNQVSESTLKAPSAGQVTAINKKVGETVSAADAVVDFLPIGPFQIEADIYEEDIVDIALNDPVIIEIPAFPGVDFTGSVISVDPAEKLVDGVVYYEVNISFDTKGRNIKPGMTADVGIETEKRENVLRVSAGAIDGNSVRVYVDGEPEQRTIELGLIGDDFAEVLSGLDESDQVIISERQ